MLIPWGFGQWPRVFPWAITAISSICLVWSYSFFPNLEAASRQMKMFEEGDKRSIEYNLKLAIISGCRVRFPGDAFCDQVGEKLVSDNSKQAHKDLEPLLKKSNVSVTGLMNFMIELAQSPDRWPDDIKGTVEYQRLQKEIKRIRTRNKAFSEVAGMATTESADFFRLMRATFTHGNYSHLLGNLFFLIIFGVWVEQRVGLMLALLTFVSGSFAGLATQLLMESGNAVLGASAGISALMGSFFIYFLRAEFQFVFTFSLLYFRKIWIPLLWVFPFLYLAADFTAVMAQGNSGVAHWAHLGGLCTGFLVALMINQLLPMQGDVMFLQEEDSLRTIYSSTDPEALWSAFADLNKWNSQNWQGTEKFLGRLRELNISYGDPDRQRELARRTSDLVGYAFRRGAVDDMIRVLSLVPIEQDIKVLLRSAPTSQLVFLADKTANQQHFALALPLYTVAFENCSDPQQRELIKGAIEKINELSFQTSFRREAA